MGREQIAWFRGRLIGAVVVVGCGVAGGCATTEEDVCERTAERIIECWPEIARQICRNSAPADCPEGVEELSDAEEARAFDDAKRGCLMGISGANNLDDALDEIEGLSCGELARIGAAGLSFQPGAGMPTAAAAARMMSLSSVPASPGGMTPPTPALEPAAGAAASTPAPANAQPGPAPEP